VWIQEVMNAYNVDDVAQKLLQELVVVSPNDKRVLSVPGVNQTQEKNLGRCKFNITHQNHQCFSLIYCGWPFRC
jgi:hypothetical protein